MHDATSAGCGAAVRGRPGVGCRMTIDKEKIILQMRFENVCDLFGI